MIVFLGVNTTDSCPIGEIKELLKKEENNNSCGMLLTYYYVRNCEKVGFDRLVEEGVLDPKC